VNDRNYRIYWIFFLVFLPGWEKNRESAYGGGKVGTKLRALSPASRSFGAWRWSAGTFSLCVRQSEKSFPPRETQFLFVRPRVSRKIIDSQIVPLARNTLKQSDQRFDYGVVSLYLAVNFHGHFFAVHMRCHVPCLQQ